VLFSSGLFSNDKTLSRHHIQWNHWKHCKRASLFQYR